MKIQIVYDIAPNSTRDVADGLRDALRQLGHEVCGTATHSMAVHFMRPFSKETGGDPSKLPKEVSAILWGAINTWILGQTTLFRPDAVIVVSGWVMGRQIVEAMQRELGAKVALYCTESPYQDREQTEQPAFPAYDLVFCNELSSMAFMQEHHDRVVYLPHSYNPEVHAPMIADAPKYDVYMCGTGFTERLSVLRGADWTGVRLKLDGFWPQHEGIAGEVKDDMVPNGTLPAIYSSVPINLNIHRTTRTWLGGSAEETHIPHAESIGPRVFEVLACGGFLITDHRAEMDGFLRDGEHLVVYRDATDLGEKARWYLQHTDERRRIAAAGRAAVADCTFSRRCSDIVLPALEGVITNG